MIQSMLSDLNPNQLIAATTLQGPLLVLAGAGSGKTKTVISRTFNIIASSLADPSEVLIMTFTNKAAREMKERGAAMLSKWPKWNGEMPNFTTFHSWGVDILRKLTNAELNSVSLRMGFSICDSSDQKIIITKIIHSLMEEDELEKFKADSLLLPLGDIQNRLVRYNSAENAFEDMTAISNQQDNWLKYLFPLSKKDPIEVMSNVYYLYKKELRENNMVDFEDLIGLPILLMKMNENIKERVSGKYKFLMIDEFQDTNGSQIELLKLLLNEDQNICVVGDNDQSIYGWRGANIEYILNFHNMYPTAKIVNLDINYRSTNGIVCTANQLLLHATQKHELKSALRAFNMTRGNISARFFNTPQDEAGSVVKKIKESVSRGAKFGDFAVLYRAAYVNKVIERELIKQRVPYNIHRGKALLDKKVPTDIITYLKFLSNTDNSLALGKILIAAGIATDRRVSQLLFKVEEMNISLYEYLVAGDIKIKGFPADLSERIAAFGREISFYLNKNDDFEQFKQDFFDRNCISKVYKRIVNSYMKGEKIKGDVYENAIKSLALIDDVSDIMNGFKSLQTFLDGISLEGEKDDCSPDRVNLMTVHASKGLEFENVFVMGLTQGVFPSDRCSFGHLLEEERRLAYVALTRAKKGLYVSGCGGYFGEKGESMKAVSQFMYEAELI